MLDEKAEMLDEKAEMLDEKAKMLPRSVQDTAPPNVNIGVSCPAGVFLMVAQLLHGGSGSPTWQSSFSCMVAKLLGTCRTLASCTLLVRCCCCCCCRQDRDDNVFLFFSMDGLAKLP